MQKLFDRVQQTVLSSHIMDIDQLLAKRANSKPKFNSESAKSHVLKDMHALHHSTTRLSTIPQDMNNERVKPEDLRNIVTQEDGSSIASSRARNKVTPVVKVLSASG